MYLRDYLHDIPLKFLKRIAAHLGVSVEYRARIKLLNAIDRAFWDGTLTRRLVRSLSDNERRVLSLVAFSYDAGISEQITARKMEKLSGISPREVRNILDGLTLSSLIGGIQAGDTLYFSPRGISEQVRNILASDVAAHPDSPESVPSSPFPSLIEDIFSFLASVYREPVPLTLKGNIKRTVLERIFFGSPTGEAAPGHFSPEDRNAFVREYLIDRGLLRLTPREGVVTPELDGWLGLSMTDRMQDVVTFSLCRFLSESQAIVPFSGLMHEIPAGASLNPSALSHLLYTGTTASGSASRLQGRVWQMMSVLGYLGLFLYHDGIFTMTETGERFFRGKRLPVDDNVSRSFSMQPNFEVLIGPELDPRVRFTLELMSCRKSRDIILTSVVNRGGVALARERGLSTDDVMTFFENHSRTPLPQNVRFSIDNWAKAYGSIHFEHALLMRFRDAATCDSAMHIPEIAPFIHEQISDTILTISPERMHGVAALLRKSGYLPEIAGEVSPDPARSGETYTPTTIRTLLAEYSIPEQNRAFVFPEENNEEHSEGDIIQ